MARTQNHDLDQAAFIRFRLWCALAFLILVVALQVAFGAWPLWGIVLAMLLVTFGINACKRFFILKLAERVDAH
ncbi:MAG: hypothetical protein ABL309_13770 [Phycisphaerales bacterium]